MAKWFFEPGHTGGGVFCASYDGDFRPRPFQRYSRHACLRSGGPGRDFRRGHIEASGIWTGEAARDAHLKSEDFLDVEKHPKITFAGKHVELPARTKRFSRAS